jgi:hypothetical protein
MDSWKIPTAAAVAWHGTGHRSGLGRAEPESRSRQSRSRAVTRDPAFSNHGAS